jgi:dolichol kinase
MELKNEFYRKSLHFLLILVPIIFCYLGKSLFLLILLPFTALVVGLDYFRKSNYKIREIFLKYFHLILRPHERDGQKLCGASWVALGACVTFLLFKKEIAVTAFLVLVISDALSALIGKAYPSKPFFEKSFNGALAFFISGLMVLIACGLIFDIGIWFYFFSPIALAATTIIEARPSLFKIDDNFTIPIAFATVLTFFDLVWHL